MENESNRNLAYLLATKINQEDLSNISGGSENTVIDHSLQPTGNNIHNADLSYDIGKRF